MAEDRGWMVRAVGVVRSPVRERKQMPPLGVPAAVELFPEYEPALLHLEKHSHLWVLAWLDGAERDLLQVIPRGVSAEDPDAWHGVFAVRSPVRPNPIGLTAARIVRVDGTRIELSRLDFLDGTPVLDLKPYFANRDLIFAAANRPIGKPAKREHLRESLLEQAVNFHGELCGDLALGVRVFEHFRWKMLQGGEPPQWRLAVCLRRPCLVDAVMGISRASFGRGSLRPARGASVCIEHDGKTYCYHLNTPTAEPQAVLEAPDEVLFRVSVRKPRRANSAAAARNAR